MNWADAHLPAIVEAWYPGEEGGTALADVLFGDYNPAGRLPVTFYRSADDLPPFEDYRMAGRTVSLLHGRITVSVRLWAELHDVRLRRSGAGADAGGRRRDGDIARGRDQYRGAGRG